MSTVVRIEVALEVPEGLNDDEIQSMVSECDYEFKHPDILGHEIRGILGGEGETSSSLEASTKARYHELIEKAVRLLLDFGKAVAPDKDYQDAMHTDGPDGLHPLIMAEDDLAGSLTDVEQSIVCTFSREWPGDERSERKNKAAYALVNEAYDIAEGRWAQAHEGPRP